MRRLTYIWPYLTLSIACCIVLYLIFGAALWQPNDYAFMIGGDGNIIYYNLFYHTLYGSGSTLSSMNYLDPECILMTDAQGMLAMALNNLNIIFPWVSGHVLGIVHVLFMIGIWLQYIVLYKVLRRIDAPMWMSVLFAICIGTLAPQLVRMKYGHLGLAYPFMIPLAILWLWNLNRAQLTNTVTVVFILVTLFFGFNNPYLLVLVAILLLSYGGIEMLQDRFRKILGVTPLVFGFGFLILLFVITLMLDPYDDRIHHQWGHFYYASTIEGILWGKYSLLNKIISFIDLPFEGQSEARASISLVTFMICVLSGIYAIKKIISGRKIPWHHPAIKLTLAAAVTFLYASAFLKSKWWYWIVEDSGFITMVKATGRLSWIVYYTISILTVFIIIKLFRKYPGRDSKIIIVLIGIIWLMEGHIYITQHVKLPLYENHFALSHLEGYIQKKEEVIDFSNYQALHSIPVIQSWNDNIYSEGDWATEVHGIATSSATGLPLIHSRLSRAPVGRSLENIQVNADPLIYKPLVDKLDQTKPVLVLKMNEIETLTSGEQFLIEQSRMIYTDDQLSLYELWPRDINDSAVKDRALNACNDTSWYYYNGLNTQSNDCNKQGSSGMIVDDDWLEIDKIIIPDSIKGLHELSIWSKVNVTKAGMPIFEIFVFNAEGQQKSYGNHDSRRSLNNQQGWSQFQVALDLAPNDQIVLKGRGNYPMCVDELLLRPLEKGNVCLKNEEDAWIINNILIE